jgi:Phosphotransferase enzyme family
LRLPLVFTHGDLNGLNILTDEDGRITGVIDWGESEWKPFAIGLYGLDIFLGSMGSDGYSSVDGYDKLRGEFFETLWRNMPPEMISRRKELEKGIELAEIVGVLYRHLEWRVDGSAMTQMDFQYLEGCLKVWRLIERQ